MSYELPLDYNDVASRIAEFRDKHPDGSLQQVSVDFREVADTWWVVYTAAAFRSPEDPRPGHGTAWERVPGKTPYTKDSELQNAETAAWGRAIVAVLAADTKKGISSAEEVRNRREPPPDPRIALFSEVKAAGHKRGMSDEETAEDFAAWSEGTPIRDATPDQLTRYVQHLSELEGVQA